MKALHKPAVFRAVPHHSLGLQLCFPRRLGTPESSPAFPLSSASQADTHSPWEILAMDAQSPQDGFQWHTRGLRHPPRECVCMCVCSPPATTVRKKGHFGFCLPLFFNSCWRQERFQLSPNSSLSPCPCPFSRCSYWWSLNHFQPSCLPCSFCPWWGVAAGQLLPGTEAGLGILPKADAAGLGQQRAPLSWEESRRSPELQDSPASLLSCLLTHSSGLLQGLSTSLSTPDREKKKTKTRRISW